MKRIAIIALVVLSTACFDILYGSAYELERERVTRENHAFHVNEGAHDAMDCNDCHGAFDTFTRYTCISCKDHEQAAMDPIHQGNPGYVYADANCYECHPTGEGMSREQHQSLFPILGGRHGNVTCQECHPSGYGSFSCISCHEHLCSEMNSKHQEVSGYACEDIRCLECHPQGRAEDD